MKSFVGPPRNVTVFLFISSAPKHWNSVYIWHFTVGLLLVADDGHSCSLVDLMAVPAGDLWTGQVKI